LKLPGVIIYAITRAEADYEYLIRDWFFGGRIDWPFCEIPAATEEIKMNRYIPFMTIIVVLVSAAFGDVLADEQNSDVSIIITKFQVNDQTLELGWKIINNTDHDVWICETMNTNAQLPKFETFIAQDAETLMIRRRFDLPLAVSLERPIGGRYIRLGSGQEHTDSISLNLPVDPRYLFEVELGNAGRAGSLALEIVFFDEDLQSMILRIVEMADKLNCTWKALGDLEIYGRFFGGLWIAGHFNGSAYPYFRESVNSGGDEILMPNMGRARLGEQVLQLKVDGVSIIYRSNYPPLTGQGLKSTTEKQSRQVSGSEPDKPVSEKRWDWNRTEVNWYWKD
jgi:hypothetical protein